MLTIEVIIAAIEVGDHGHPFVDLLPAIVDVACLEQAQCPVTEHFRMNSQVVFLPQEMKNGVGNGTNAQLNGSTVLNQAGTVLSNALPQGERDGGRGAHHILRPGQCHRYGPEYHRMSGACND